MIGSALAKKLAAAGLPYAGGIPADPTIGTARWGRGGRVGWRGGWVDFQEQGSVGACSAGCGWGQHNLSGVPACAPGAGRLPAPRDCAGGTPSHAPSPIAHAHAPSRMHTPHHACTRMPTRRNPPAPPQAERGGAGAQCPPAVRQRGGPGLRWVPPRLPKPGSTLPARASACPSLQGMSCTRSTKVHPPVPRSHHPATPVPRPHHHPPSYWHLKCLRMACCAAHS